MKKIILFLSIIIAYLFVLGNASVYASALNAMSPNGVVYWIQWSDISLVSSKKQLPKYFSFQTDDKPVELHNDKTDVPQSDITAPTSTTTSDNLPVKSIFVRFINWFFGWFRKN